MELDKKICPIVDVDGFIAGGKQFDLEIVLPEDSRDVIYGVVKDCYQDPICNAVVKLIEVCGDERKPVSHTFTDKDGEFVFGPLCPDKYYEVQVWVNRVKHVKLCARCKHDGKCLKGVEMDQCDFTMDRDKDKWDTDKCDKDKCDKDKCDKDKCDKDKCNYKPECNC